MRTAVPHCPACLEKIQWRHSFSLWNPWNFPCPHCKVPLEASRVQKTMVVAMVPTGLLLAGVAIFFKQRGIWHTRESLAFFGIVVPALIVGAWVSWAFTRFKVKADDA